MLRKLLKNIGVIYPLFGWLSLVLAGVLGIYHFWAISGNVRDALVLTAYVVDIGPDQKVRFGYGGEATEDQVDVPFQGREMSNVSFVISRSPFDTLKIVGRDDRIRVGKTWYEPGQEATLSNKDRIETRGWLGRAGFQIFFDEQSNKLRLQLDTPLYRELGDGETRVIFGVKHEPVPTSIDEIFFRTAPGDKPRGQSFKVIPRDEVLHFDEEVDTSLLVGGSSTGPSSSPTPVKLALNQNESLPPRNNLELKFHHYIGVARYGFLLVLALILLGLVYLTGPQVHWPHETLIFGSTALLVTVGVILSAYSYLFIPHNPYFPRYLTVLYYSSIILFWLRVPFGPQTTLRSAGGIPRIVWSWFLYMVIFLLMIEPFKALDGMWGTLKTLLIPTIVFLVLGFIVLGVTYAVQDGLKHLTNSPWPFKQFIIVMFIIIGVPSLVLLLAKIFGGREAIPLFIGSRIHIPTLLLPFLTASMAVLITAARTQTRNRKLILPATLLVLLGILVAYRLYSNDNGGTAILGIGMLAAFWLSWREWVMPAFLTAVFIVVIALAAYVNKPERFDIAVGSQQALQYFDQERNLRLARDLARAGGWLGLGSELTIPSGLRSNLHNDLVTAYIAGFFGWVVLLWVLFAYGLLYERLWRGLFEVLQAYSPQDLDSPSQNLRMRQILVTTSLAVLVVSMVQTLWMIISTLSGMLPLTGLDLQPISNSSISVFGFIVGLFGLVALTQTNHKALPQ